MKTPCSKFFLAGIAALALGVPVSLAQTLYVRYDFNDPQSGSSIADSGDIGGFTGTYDVGKVASPINTGTSGDTMGVSGKAGDYALPGLQLGAPAHSKVNMLLDGTATFPMDATVVSSFTFTFWFKGDISSSGGNAGRIFESVKQPGDATSTLFYKARDGDRNFRAVGFGRNPMTSPPDAFSETDEWIFVALAFDAVNDIYSYYKGTTTSAVALVSSDSNMSNGWAPNPNDTLSTALIANRSTLDRRLGVALDDFRLYGATDDSLDGALSQAQLETIRREGINNTPPGTGPRPDRFGFWRGGFPAPPSCAPQAGEPGH
jgi:hypothetical protein